jgi:SAM-dependent methyltransferase
MPRFLHVGCGPKRKNNTTPGCNRPEWEEIRLDINEAARPDIVGTMVDMSAVPDDAVDAIYSSHNIEHVFAHEVPAVLREFRRVLKPDGFAVITCPDLQSLAKLVVEDRLTEPAYQSLSGPISVLDCLYGFGPSIARGEVYMAHKTGFTRRSLDQSLSGAGFASIATMQRAAAFELWAIAAKARQPPERMQALVRAHFPLQIA